MDVILVPLLNVISLALGIYVQLIIISVIFSWLVAFNVINTRNQFVYMVGDFLNRVTEPAYRKIRQYLPPMGGLDLSPLVLILVIYFFQGVVGRLAYSMM